MFRRVPAFLRDIEGGIKMKEKNKNVKPVISLEHLKVFFGRNSIARCRGQYPDHNKWFVCCVKKVRPTIGGEKAIVEVRLRGKELSYPLDPERYPDKSSILPPFFPHL